jgi:hypothetical protein
MRADKTPVEPVLPDPASRYLRAALPPAQFGQLPAFAHNAFQDSHPYRSANGGLL